MNSIDVTSALLPLVAGYLAGSIPFGLLIARLGGAGDVRAIGSGNIGATNVLRTGRKGLAALTLLADMFKAVLVMLLFLAPNMQAAIIAGFGAFLGHLFPVWLKFKGGKGVAVYVGVLLVASWHGLLVFALMWLGTAFISRFSSLAALFGTLIAPLAVWLISDRSVFVAAVLAVMTIITWIMHRENIRRLVAGTEGKIGAKSSKPDDGSNDQAPSAETPNS